MQFEVDKGCFVFSDLGVCGSNLGSDILGAINLIIPILLRSSVRIVGQSIVKILNLYTNLYLFFPVSPVRDTMFGQDL